MPAFRIRSASAADIEPLLAMTARMYRKDFLYTFDPGAARPVLETQLASKLCLTLVAEGESGLAGFISVMLKKPDRRFTMDGRLGRVSDIYVEPPMRGQGVAGALLEAAETWMRENGVSLCECDVMRDNERGNAFWREKGYGEMAILRGKSLR